MIVGPFLAVAFVAVNGLIWWNEDRDPDIPALIAANLIAGIALAALIALMSTYTQ